MDDLGISSVPELLQGGHFLRDFAAIWAITSKYRPADVTIASGNQLRCWQIMDG